MISLHATYIRNYIVKALRASSETASLQDVHKRVSQNIVYAHPTVKGLAMAVASIVAPESLTSYSIDQARHVEELVAKYSADLTVVPEGRLVSTTNIVVLLSGSTGSLGSYLLATFITDPRVSRVYAFNRGSRSSSALERHKDSFRDRGLPASLLEANQKLVFITGDFSQPNFDLEQNTYQEVLIFFHYYTAMVSELTSCLARDFDHTCCSQRMEGRLQSLSGLFRISDSGKSQIGRFLFIS